MHRTRPRMATKRQRADDASQSASPNLFVRLIDPLVVLLVKLIILLGEIKSRNVLEDPHRALRPDQKAQTRLKNWRAILDWPPGRRVGWFVAVVLGSAAGGVFLSYML